MPPKRSIACGVQWPPLFPSQPSGCGRSASSQECWWAVLSEELNIIFLLPLLLLKGSVFLLGSFWFDGIKDSRTRSNLRVMADKCLHCLKEMFWGCDALQCCLNSKQNYMPLWLWRFISVTHSSLASPAHFCNVCRWCGALCQSYLSASSLLTQLPLWAILGRVKYWTITQLFCQPMSLCSSCPKGYLSSDTRYSCRLLLISQLKATGTLPSGSLSNQKTKHFQNTHERQTLKL